MKVIRSYLQLTRLHTAPLETVPALLGAMLATGGEINILVLLWGLYGLLYHAAGYGMNSIVDWQKGYDQLDRNKQHHPLNRGSITLYRASLFVAGLFLVLVALGVGLAWDNFPAISFMALGALAGVLYNTIGKETPYKFLLISFAHATVFIVPYLAMGGELSLVFLLASLYVFIWVLYQISVSGEIKDIMMDEANFLRDNLRVYIYEGQDRLTFSVKAKFYSLTVKTLNLVVGLFLFLAVEGDTITTFIWVVIWAVMSTVVIGTHGALTENGWYRRSHRIDLMARMELFTLIVFCFALYPVVGEGVSITLIIGSVVWVVVLNLAEWGTVLAPDV